MSALRTAIRAADDDYLTALANKGLLRRAQRELPDAGLTLEAGEEAFTARFADGTTVTVEGSIQNYRCTCPSRSACKHLLMALLAIRDAPNESSGEEPGKADAEPGPDFSALAALTPEALTKLAGKKRYRTALLAVQLGEEAEIQEGSTLAVTLKDSGFTVRFLPGGSAESARCGCKDPEICVHRIQAALHYIARVHGGLPIAFTAEEDGDDAPAFSAATLPYLRGLTAEALRTGLARLPEDWGGRFLQLATICHGQRLPNLERLCKRISGQLELYRARSAGFQTRLLIGDLTEVLRLCDAIEGGDGSRETVGVFREQYRPVAALELWGLGAYSWQSAGGFTGVTTLFYCPQESRVLTYGAVLPKDAARPRGGLTPAETLYRGGAPWNLPAKLSSLGHTKLLLKGGRLSPKGQLSASESAMAQSLGSADPMAPELEALRFGDFDRLLSALWEWRESGEEGDMTAILLPARAGAGSYDKIRQQWTLPLYDSQERRLTLSVRYQPVTKPLLETLMELDEAGGLCTPMLVRAGLRDGRLTGFPVTLYGPARRNLGLDRDEAKRRKPRRFDWGDGV